MYAYNFDQPTLFEIHDEPRLVMLITNLHKLVKMINDEYMHIRQCDKLTVVVWVMRLTNICLSF
jgi:hypothetical protein